MQQRHVGDDTHPYNVFDFTLSRGRDGPKCFLEDYNQVLLADGYGGYNGVVAGNGIVRAGCWAHLRRKIIDAEKAAPEIPDEAIALLRAPYAVEKQTKDSPVEERLRLRLEQSEPVLATLREKFLTWKKQLLPKHPMAEALNYAPRQWAELNVFADRRRSAHRQQCLRAREEARNFKSEEQPLRRQRARRPNSGHPGQPDFDPSAA
jgi:transposase